MKDYLFPALEGKKNTLTKLCPKCKKSELSIKMRKNGSGPFVACTSHPACDYIRGEVFPDENKEDIESNIC